MVDALSITRLTYSASRRGSLASSRRALFAASHARLLSARTRSLRFTLHVAQRSGPSRKSHVR